MLRRRPSPAFVLAFVALLVAMSGAGYAAIPAKDGDVHLCYSKKTGAVTVVDTKSDDFDCEKNWVGFTFDTKPTKITSPNGKFFVEATDTGARMVGPDADVTVGAGTVKVQGSKGVDVRSDSVAVTAGGTASLTGGDDVDVTAGEKLDLESGADAGLTVGKTLALRSGDDLTLNSTKKGSFVTGDSLTLRSAKDTIFDVGKSLTQTVAENLGVTGKKVNVTSNTDMTLKTKNFLVNATGKVDIKASKDINLKGSKINENR